MSTHLEIVQYTPTLLKVARARAKHFSRRLNVDTNGAIEHILLSKVTTKELISQHGTYSFESPMDELFAHPKVFYVRTNTTRRAIRKIASTNTRILVDEMCRIDQLAHQQDHDGLHRQDELSLQSFTTALSWLCPLWPFC